jgi:hypothetical protein
MKITPIFVTILLATAAFSSSVRAAQSFSNSFEATTDSDVYVGASTALAFDFEDSPGYANTGSTTVNGVVFTGSESNLTTGVSLSLTNFGGGGTNGVYAPGLAMTASTQYADILTGLVYNNNTPVVDTMTLSGLTSGKTYELQVFDGTTGPNGSETLTDVTTIPGPTPPSPFGVLNYGLGTPSASAADFIDERFTATSSGIETIDFSTTTGYNIVSAVNLQVIPEPSTFALVFGGMGFLVYLARRKPLQLS